MACTTTGIQIIIVLFAFTIQLFPTKLECSAKQLLVVSKQTSHRSLHAFCTPLPCSISHLEGSVEQLLAADPYARTVGGDRLLIVTSMNNIKSPTNATITTRL